MLFGASNDSSIKVENSQQFKCTFFGLKQTNKTTKTKNNSPSNPIQKINK